jgi:hypothetical protein
LLLRFDLKTDERERHGSIEVGSKT